jgi:NAD(P)-dependent dehydrogenase (short-subunit alcohol dehydrogenase family)
VKGVLITGGTGGIGSALVRTLRTSGRDVCFTYKRRTDAARELEEETGAWAVAYDGLDPESRSALCRLIRESEFDGLVNLGADRAHRQSFLKSDCDQVLTEVHQGLAGPFTLCHSFAGSCREKQRPGAIVNVLTSYVLGLPPEKMTAYIILKHALLGLSRSLAVELAKFGIRVNAVSPAMTRTGYISDLPERFVQMHEEGLPLARLAAPEEVAAVIVFLLSPSAAYIHGANIPIAGGTAC